MATTLLAFHGFSLNGKHMREQLEPLLGEPSLPIHLECPNAPHTCPKDTVERLLKSWGMPVLAPPHLRWWNASDDGRTYAGWQESRDRIAGLMQEHEDVGVLGFSQGAMVAAAVAALADRGELPKVRFAVIIAGRTPRAEELAPAFASPIQIPSLHVWGERDGLAAHAPGLADCFAPELREVCVWPGSHVVPTSGPAAEAIVSFIRRHA